MSTKQEATPPARIWIDWRERDAQRHIGSYYLCSREGFSTEYIRANSFDTMRDALVAIARQADTGRGLATPIARCSEIHRLASSALAAIDGKDGGDGADAG